ncbi:MAG TPA: serine/threonine-protein kinase [Vicinamibacteria bacterium]|nr:serine/threonine-protein kinase [Vicinamibacteria bacterium]
MRSLLGDKREARRLPEEPAAEPTTQKLAVARGTRLGPYEVIGLIGAGGMGEVYRARDTRLGRDVAVKVIPEELATDPDRLARFEQEARLAGSLSHPNVLTLHDVGMRGGAPYLVTELLEGRSLRDVLERGPLPVRRAVEHAQQIARGLAAAHAKGIVHRDLKPANIFVTKDGAVKILDFGLAKLTQTEPPDLEGSTESTTTADRVIGTVGYMAPEQVRGRPADVRSDIFAFGAVAYEMLSGRRAFAGDTAADTMTAVLTRDPDELSRPGLSVPASLERIVRRCLEKDPEERFQSARDVAFALDAESGASRARMEPAAETARPRRRWLVATAIAVPLLLAAAGIGLLFGRKLGERPLPKITQLTFRRGTVDRARFTADGKTVVYSAFWDGNPPEIFTTRVESPESRSLGLPPARLMSVSTGELAILLTAPGDRSDATTGTLARVPLAGGEPRRVLDDVLAADWSPDGRGLAVIRRVDAVGERPPGGGVGGEFQVEYPIGRVLARPVSGIQLRVSPHGDRVAVLEPTAVHTYDTMGRKTRFRTPAAIYGLAWASDNSLWVSGGETYRTRSLYLVTPDGSPRELYRPAGSLALQDATSDGRLLIHHGFERVGVRATPAGQPTEWDLGVFSWSWAADLSDDGEQLLTSEGDAPGRMGGSGVTAAYVRPTRGGPPVRLGPGTPLALSPNGKWALMASLGERPLFSVTPTGAGTPRTLPLDRFAAIDAAWFLDDGRLVVDAREGTARSRAFLVDSSGVGPRPIMPEGFVSVRGSFGGDGVLGAAPDGALARYPLRGGGPEPIAARLPPEAVPLRATAHGRFILFGRTGMPYRVDRLDLVTGESSPWRSLRPDDLTGATHILTPAFSADGEAYAYTYGRYFQDLYLIEGLRP